MALLKKLSAATITETLVASTLIMIVFVIGSMSMNQIFQSVVTTQTSPMENRVSELQYLVHHHQLNLPHFEETDQWEIEIIKNGKQLKLSSTHKPSGRQIQKKIDAIEP